MEKTRTAATNGGSRVDLSPTPVNCVSADVRDGTRGRLPNR